MAKKIPTCVQSTGPGKLPYHIFSFDDVDEHELSVGHFALINSLVHESDGAHFSYEARIEADLLHAIHDCVRAAGNLRALGGRQGHHHYGAPPPFSDGW